MPTLTGSFSLRMRNLEIHMARPVDATLMTIPIKSFPFAYGWAYGYGLCAMSMRVVYVALIDECGKLPLDLYQTQRL
eukprot:200117-Pleurochrysis_carterae.AAC.1